MGFPCTPLSYKERSDSPFCARVFPTINQRKRKKIRANDLIDVFNDDTMWAQLSDADAVRVCLLIVAELVFIGRQSSYYIPNHILTLVEDFDDWNAYSWGEYLWKRLYEKIVNVVPVHYNRYYKKKIETDPKKLATYNLEGFVWALKIWILDSYPNSKIWWQKDPLKTPCGVAWSKLKTFSKREYSVLFGLVDTPILETPEIVGQVHAQEQDVTEVHAHVVTKDSLVEVTELVGQVQANQEQDVTEVPGNVGTKYDSVEVPIIVDEVTTLKTILGLIDKAVGNVVVVDVVRKRLAAIEKVPEQSVDNDSENVMPIHNAEDGKLNYLDPGAYPSAMSQLSKISDLKSLDPVVDCLQVDNGIDQRLPNLNEPFFQENLDFADYMDLDKEGNKADPHHEKVRETVLDTEENNSDSREVSKVGDVMLQKEENNLSLDDHTSSSGFADDYDELNESLDVNVEKKAAKAKNLQDTILDNEESDTQFEFGLRDCNEAEKENKANPDDEKVRETVLDTEDNNSDSREVSKVGDVMLEKEKNNSSLDDHTSSSGFADVENKDDEAKKLQETVLDTEENDTPFEFGLRDFNEAEVEKKANLADEKVRETVLDTEENNSDSREFAKVGDVMLEKEENKDDPDDEKVDDHTSSSGFADDYDELSNAIWENEENNADESEKEKEDIAECNDVQKEKENQMMYSDKVEKKSPRFINVVQVGDRPSGVDVFNSVKRKRNLDVADCNEAEKEKKKQMMYSDKVENNSEKFINVVQVGDRPSGVDVLNTVKRKRNVDVQEQKRTRYPGRACKSPYMEPPPTTPAVPKRRFKRTNESAIMPIAFAAGDGEIEVPVWTEDLSRPANCIPDKINIPPYMEMFIKKGKKCFHKFPWGKFDIVANRQFWLALLGYGRYNRRAWLMDEHLDLWVDLMWSFRPSNADWAMAGPFFYFTLSTIRPNKSYANGKRYPVPWSNVEKVYFPINVPKEHYFLAELQLRNGVVTFYDSLGTPPQETRDDFVKMRANLKEALPKYLDSVGVFKEKGIPIDDYKITFKVGENVPVQAEPYGDCGVWVCIFLYRLSNNLTLEVDDPLQVALAYREHMAEYYWNYKIPLNKGM